MDTLRFQHGNLLLDELLRPVLFFSGVAEVQQDLLGQLPYLAGMELGEIIQLLWIAVEMEELMRRMRWWTPRSAPSRVRAAGSSPWPHGCIHGWPRIGS